MPLLKKLLWLGRSRVVVLPAGWLSYYEEKLGHPIEDVLLTLKDDNIIIVIDHSKYSGKNTLRREICA